MDNTILSRRWIRLALVYFTLAVCLGVYMGASHDFRLRPVHVHVNMLGWVSAALTGCVYWLFPQAAATRLGAFTSGCTTSRCRCRWRASRSYISAIRE